MKISKTKLFFMIYTSLSAVLAVPLYAQDSTTPEVFDCTQPEPPAPRCPASLSSACAAAWEPTLRYREFCGTGAPVPPPEQTLEDPQATPDGTVNLLFDLIREERWSELSVLCDPRGENDGDTRSLCALEEDESSRAEAVEYLSASRVTGPAEISETFESTMALVPIVIGPEGHQRDERMNLVRRDGRWFLLSF